MESTTGKVVSFELPAEDTADETKINADVIPVSTSLSSLTHHDDPELIYPSMLTAPKTLGRTCLCMCYSSIYTLGDNCVCEATCSCADGCSVLSTGVCTCTCGDITETLGTEQWMLPASDLLTGDAETNTKVDDLYRALETLEQAQRDREGDRQWFEYDVGERLRQLESSDSQKSHFQQHQSGINLQLVRSIQRQDRNMDAVRAFMEQLSRRCDESEAILRRIRAQNRRKSGLKTPVRVAETEVAGAGTSPEMVLSVGLQKPEPQPGSATGQ